MGRLLITHPDYGGSKHLYNIGKLLPDGTTTQKSAIFMNIFAQKMKIHYHFNLFDFKIYFIFFFKEIPPFYVNTNTYPKPVEHNVYPHTLFL
jgi:hypothetical protein